MKASEAIVIAKAEVGVSENPANSNLVKYNDWYYGKSGIGQPWCCAFIAWIFKNTKLVMKTASCQEMLAYFERNGQTVTTPKKGDIAFFKYSTNNRRTNHIGIVTDVNGKQIRTIEGNTSSSIKGSQDNGGIVCERVRSSNIVAYARPNYDDAWKLVKRGDKGVFVKKLQHLLNVQYGQRLAEDGDFGLNTYNALISAQGMMGTVEINGKRVNVIKDGEAGEQVWTKLLKI